MKFTKLTLDESLFDDFAIENDSLSASTGSMFDDDFSVDEDFMEGPEAGIQTGIADTIMNLINDEWEAVQGYNNFIELLRNSGNDAPEVVRVIQDIAAEENKHVGQLQELLKTYSPNANQIRVGEQEAQHQMTGRQSMISGLQFWDTDSNQTPAASASMESEAFTNIDVDDEF